MEGDGHDVTNTDSSEESHQAHCCEIKVSFPTNLQARQAMDVLAVDPEPTNRVSKHFRILQEAAENKREKHYMVV